MKTSVIQREELISMLEAMSKQLEQLELSMVTNRLYCQNEWLKRQESQIEECGKELDSLEMKISSAEEYHDHNNTSFLKIKFSY